MMQKPFVLFRLEKYLKKLRASSSHQTFYQTSNDESAARHIKPNRKMFRKKR